VAGVSYVQAAVDTPVGGVYRADKVDSGRACWWLGEGCIEGAVVGEDELVVAVVGGYGAHFVFVVELIEDSK
jgi:hypothetical protein